MIENVLLKLGILNDHTNDEFARVELFLEMQKERLKSLFASLLFQKN